MATALIGFKSREDHRKQLELEEARKAGLVPAEVDEDGKEINPHVPRYMSSAPWYLINSSNADHHRKPSLKHQRKWKYRRRCSRRRPTKLQINIQGGKVQERLV